MAMRMKAIGLQIAAVHSRPDLITGPLASDAVGI
jgi:hypothetical protein